MRKKDASSQVAWALLIEGVAHARVEAHRMRHLMERALKLVEASEEREHLHAVAGDIIHAMPKRLDRLEVDLDRTALALSRMGKEFLEARLSLSDKMMVEEAVQSAFGGGQVRQSIEARVARRWVEGTADDPQG